MGASGRDHELLRAVGALGEDLDLRGVLVRIVDAACALVSARYGALGVIGPDGQLVEFVHRGVGEDIVSAIGQLPSGHGVLGAVVADPRPLRLEDLHRDPRSVGFPANHPPMRTFLGVPVRLGHAVFGNLYLTERTDGLPFDEADEAVAVALAAAAASAISNAQLYDAAMAQASQLRAVHGVANALLSGAGESVALELIALHARELLAADGALIALMRSDGTHLENRHVVGEIVRDLQGTVVPLADRTTTRVVGAGESVVVPDLSSCDDVGQPLVEMGTIGPGVFVPLKVGGVAAGTIAVVRPKASRCFTRHDVSVLESFATQAGVVIEHARAHAALAELAAVEAEERFASTLYEEVIQQIFDAGLTLASAESMLAGTEAGERVERAIVKLDEAIAHVRRRVFESRASKR